MTDNINALLNGTLNALDGTPRDLSVYRGRVLLIVNTASI